ncbi:MAG: hypothetical protein HOP28_11955 [Gemmatimonadales bacterium]|nr:hypothetical protein [Gemmatimonadales bacterium]
MTASVPWYVLDANVVQWVNLAASVATALLAAVVYLVTRSLARAETTREINSMWQHFNQTMLQDDNAARFRGYFEKGEGDLSSDYRLQYLVFMLLNNLHAEFVNGRRRFIGRRHFASTMSAHCQFMSARKSELLALMEANGFDPDFGEFIATGIRRKKAANRPRRARPTSG